jgi:hypothetical protein
MMFAIAFSFAAQVCVFSFSSKQSFAGVVYGANGPIAGAFVSASGENGSGGGVTDSSGHYSMSEGLKTGTYNVSVLAYGYLTSEIGGVPVTVGQTTSGINFDLQLSGGVSGVVTDAVSGSPLSDISVTAFSTGGGGSFGFYATTGSDGKYVMATNLPTGSYNVSIFFPEGHISLSYAANITAGFETKNVNFALAKSGIISGRITAPGGAPLANVTVGAVSGGGYFGYATTNATGYYRMVSGLGTGSYTVTAYSGLNFNFTTVSVTAGQETSGVDLELAVTPPTPSGIIIGQVTDISTGKPIPDATVTATDSEGYGSADTDTNGNYVISSGLGTGTYNVTASAPGYQDKTTTGVSVTVNLVTSNVNFQMSKIPPAQSGTITGTVTGAPNPIPEFQYPIAVALSLTLVAAAAGKLLLRTKRLKNARSLN